MAIKLKCPECKQLLAVRDELAGMRVRCKFCKTVLTVTTAKTNSDDSFDGLDEMDDFGGGDELPIRRNRNKSKKKTKGRSKEPFVDRLKSLRFNPWLVFYSFVSVVGLFGLLVPDVLIWLLVFGVGFQFVTGLIGTLGVLSVIARNSGWALVGCFVIPFWYFWYVIQHWEETKKPFMLVLKGLAVLVGIFLWGLLAVHVFGVKLPVYK